jgi:hypothetical protein
MQRAIDEETKKRPITAAERAEAKARNRRYKKPGRKQLDSMAVERREERRAAIRERMSLLVLVVVALSIAIGIAFGTTKTTAGRTVGIAAVILSSEVLLLMAPFSFFLVGLYYMDKPYEKESVKYALAAVVGWPLAFLGAAAAALYAAVRLIKSYAGPG